MNLSSKIENDDKQTSILNRYITGVINTMMIFLFIYNAFSGQYLPGYGTGITLSIIAGFAMMYIATNIFIGGINYKALSNVSKSMMLMNVDYSDKTLVSKAKKEYFIYRMLNSAKMGYISIISTALSAIFFKYKDIISKHHSTIPRFDSFFMFVIFSILSQTIYLSGLHFNYTKAILQKYLDSSYRSLMIFGILNLLNLLFVISMFSELRFMPTDG